MPWRLAAARHQEPGEGRWPRCHGALNPSREYSCRVGGQPSGPTP